MASLPASRPDYLLRLRIEQLAAELDALVAQLRGEVGPEWDEAGEVAADWCFYFTMLATSEFLRDRE